VSIARGAQTEDSFTHDLPGLAEVVARAALAVDNAVLYQRQSRIALALQRALLPSTTADLPHLQVAVRYVPGVAGLEVGGDFYDVLSLPDGSVALVIGDVMGRGLQAAAIMGQLRAAVRAYAHLTLPPHELLTAVDAVLADLDAHALVTMSYSVVDPATGRLTHASAGHLPPAMRGPDGSTTLLQGPVGPPLGSGGRQHEQATSHALPPGSVLVLCTDGLVEDRLQDIDRGLDALTTALSSAPADPNGVADHVLTTLGRSGGHDDDVALLVVSVLPSAGLER
jgi:serine phosphatase RsbU (regulator of sigma subunit)